MMGGAALAAPAGWALAGGLGEGGLAAVGTFLVSNPVGWAILGTAAIGGIGYAAWQYGHSQSLTKAQVRIITQVCSTCSDCNDLTNKIKSVRDEVVQRHNEMREDANGLYNVRPNPIKGKEFLGTWPGHQQQYENKQAQLKNLLDASKRAGCPWPGGDASKWADMPTPTKPAP